jgi:hypothetical protein
MRGSPERIADRMAGGMRVLRSSWRGAWLLLAGACLASLAWLTVAHRNGGARPQGAIPAGLQYVHALAWSADGRRAAVIGRLGDRRFAIILDTAGSQPRVIHCHALPDDLMPRPTLDGTGAHLLYAAGSPDDPRIWSLSVDDGRAEEVARGVWPRPSPVGEGLVYFTLIDPVSRRCSWHVVHGKGRSRPLSPTLIAIGDDPAWSPDAKRIAYAGLSWKPDASESGGYRVTGAAVGVTAANGDGRQEVILESYGPRSRDQGLWARYWSIGWADNHTVAVAVVREDTEERALFTIDLYDVKTGRRHSLLPVSRERELTKYGPPETADGARRVFWQVRPEEAASYQWMDLATGKSATIRFPEQVAPALSPEGSRILAVGLETANLYLARLADADGRWRVERQHLR